MPPHLESTATLATQVVDAAVPHWAATRAAVTLSDYGEPEYLAGRRSEHDVYRLPNSSQVLRDWLYTRPDVEAVDEQAFENSAIESSTIFRIDGFHVEDGSVHISPTVSNHWLLVPVQSINGVTVGLAYLDVLYQRKERDNCVPPLRLGKFAIEDNTGEIFMTGWMGPIMVVGWTQSIIKCERVRELLMYHAPEVNGVRPRNLLLRNSFYERRDCHLCGLGSSLNTLKSPCSGVSNTFPPEPTKPGSLTNVSTLYRRFRGGYYGVCLKTAYQNDAASKRDLVSVFIDVKHGLHAVKQRFRQTLRRNCDFSLDCLFGMHPRASSRVFFLRTAAPVNSFYQLSDSSHGKRKAPGDPLPASGVNKMLVSPLSSLENETSTVSSDRSTSPPSRTRRRVGVDEVDRQSIEFERKQRNRIAAERSNRQRKEKLEREREELRRLKERRDLLLKRQNELSVENFTLRMQVEAIKTGDHPL